MNSPHYNTNSKGDFVLETGLNVRFLDFLYTKIYNVNQLNNKNNTYYPPDLQRGKEVNP